MTGPDEWTSLGIAGTYLLVPLNLVVTLVNLKDQPHPHPHRMFVLAENPCPGYSGPWIVANLRYILTSGSDVEGSLSSLE
jgi:hypothetical protein